MFTPRRTAVAVLLLALSSSAFAGECHGVTRGCVRMTKGKRPCAETTFDGRTICSRCCKDVPLPAVQGACYVGCFQCYNNVSANSCYRAGGTFYPGATCYGCYY